MKRFMRHFFLPAVLGSAATALAFVMFIIPAVRDSRQAQGQTEGFIKGQSEAAATLQAALHGEHVACERLQPLFEVKTSTVHLVNCGGIKSVRVEE